MSQRAEGNKGFTLKGHTQNLTGSGTQGESSNLIGTWQAFLLVWRAPGEVGWWGAAAALPGDTDTGGRCIWEALVCQGAVMRTSVQVISDKTWPHLTASRASAGTSQSKQLIGCVGCVPTQQQRNCRLPEPTAASRHTSTHGPARQRLTTQFHLPMGRHQPLPPGSLPNL